MNAREICRFLLENGAQLHDRDDLYTVCIIDDRPLCELLVNHGVNLNARGIQGKTVLSNALEARNRALCEFFIHYGANVNNVDLQGRTLLHDALARGDLEFFALFINHGADIGIVDLEGKTLLHHAIATRHLDVCEYLLANGLDINAKDFEGNSALHRAAAQNEYHLIRFLLDWGADVHSSNAQGDTLLHIAARGKNRRLCKLLMSRGAKPCVPNNAGLTPLVLASQMPYWEHVVNHWPAYETYEQNQQRMARERGIYRGARIAQFQNARQICQDMIVHQVTQNQKIYALLGSLKKLGQDGDLVARELYRQRNSLLRPYLVGAVHPLNERVFSPAAYSNLQNERALIYPNNNNHEYHWDADSYCEFLRPANRALTRNLLRQHFTADWTEGGIVPLNNINIYDGPEAPREIQMNDNNAPVAAFELPRIAHLYPFEHPVQLPAAAPQPDQFYGDVQQSWRKPLAGIALTVVIAGIVSAATYKLYKWVKAKKAKQPKPKKPETKKQTDELIVPPELAKRIESNRVVHA